MCIPKDRSHVETSIMPDDSDSRDSYHPSYPFHTSLLQVKPLTIVFQFFSRNHGLWQIWLRFLCVSSLDKNSPNLEIIIFLDSGISATEFNGHGKNHGGLAHRGWNAASFANAFCAKSSGSRICKVQNIFLVGSGEVTVFVVWMIVQKVVGSVLSPNWQYTALIPPRYT